MVRTGGGCLNPQNWSRVEAAARAVRELMDGKRPQMLPSRPILRLPMGTVQATILTVLRHSSGGQRPKEVQLRVEQRLKREVPYDTISTFLSVAAKHKTSPVIRVSKGRYGLAGSSGSRRA